VATVLHRETRARPIRTVPPDSDVERPMWEVVAVLYAAIALLAVLLIGLCFLAAYLVTGSAY